MRLPPGQRLVGGVPPGTDKPLETRLPPGQQLVTGLPRFGTQLFRPPPEVPVDPVLKISGAGSTPFSVPVAALAELPRRQLTADFHCVSGWSATNVDWQGVAFETFYRSIIEPALPPGTSITHLVFSGHDGFRSAVVIEDALAEDVLLADRLDGRPLDGDHGAPVRLVSPNQYGYISTKHLRSIHVHTADPPAVEGSVALRILKAHPRARVWAEERHRYLPWWSVRHIYRVIRRPLIALSAKGR